MAFIKNLASACDGCFAAELSDAGSLTPISGGIEQGVSVWTDSAKVVLSYKINISPALTFGTYLFIQGDLATRDCPWCTKNGYLRNMLPLRITTAPRLTLLPPYAIPLLLYKIFLFEIAAFPLRVSVFEAGEHPSGRKCEECDCSEGGR